MQTLSDVSAGSHHCLANNFDSDLEEFLIEKGHVSPSDLAGAKKIFSAEASNRPLATRLVNFNMLSERSMAAALAEFTQLPLFDKQQYPIEPVVALPLRFLKEHGVLPVAKSEAALQVVMADPSDEYTIQALGLATDCTVERYVGVASEILAQITNLYTEAGEEENSGAALSSEAAFDDDIDQLKDMASEAPVIRAVNQIFQRALERRSSDIHVEPFQNRLKIRYRIDGVLVDDSAPPAELAAAVISRIKIMAKLDIAERRLPQDGRMRLRMQGQDVDVRVSSVPTMHGESVVMRLLQRESIALDFASLGFSDDYCQELQHVLQQPHGMLLVTGPTGSGKTTTLYAALSTLNTDERKVITVEDPVEYQLQGINQIQVKSDIGLTFASSLRSIVRQDPDVIMVGEMRDLETAKICVQSALTGHLVLSTLHTNDAASSITRLLEMGVEDYLLISTLSAIIGQRLVRLLCPHCREAYQPLPEVVAELGLDKLAKTSDAPSLQLYRAKGCTHCANSGYRGRIAIYELLSLDDDLRQLIVKKSAAADINRAAMAAGMSSMYQDGCRKALQGLTTIEEVVRVTREA